MKIFHTLNHLNKLSAKALILTSLLFFLSYHSPLTAEYDPVSVYLTWEKKPESSINIRWISKDDRQDDSIEYRESATPEWRQTLGKHFAMPDEKPYLIHEVNLIGLKPDTEYTFRAGADGKSFRFKTMPLKLSEPIRFLVGGDIYHDRIKSVSEISRQGAKTNPRFAILGGDLAYAAPAVGISNEKFDRWLHFLISIKEDLVTPDGLMIPIITAIGNHEVVGRYKETPSQAKFFYALFATPGEKGRYVLDFGNYMSIFILDSGHTHPIGGEQSYWLWHALEKRQSVPNKIAVYHMPAYPSVKNPNGHVALEIREKWVPIFEQFGLNVAFEHHNHAYKRSKLLYQNNVDEEKGVLYMGDGAWGITKPRTPVNPKDRWYLEKTAAARHIIVVTIDKDSRTYLAIDEKGNAVDEYKQKITKS